MKGRGEIQSQSSGLQEPILRDDGCLTRQAEDLQRDGRRGVGGQRRRLDVGTRRVEGLGKWRQPLRTFTALLEKNLSQAPDVYTALSAGA